MRMIDAASMAALISLAGSAALAQANLSNPGAATTAGVTQPTSPVGANTQVQNIQNINLGGATPASATNTALPSLGFSSASVSSPVVIPSRFGTSNVLSTFSPQPTVAQPLPTVTSTTTGNSLTPQQQVFTFTPSQQFQPIITPTQYLQPSQNGFRAR